MTSQHRFRVLRPWAMSVLACLALSAPALADKQGFRDDFSSFDRDRWFISSGWANGDHQNCLWHKDQVLMRENADTLLLSLEDVARKDRDFSCAEIQSNARFGYGLYEARMRVPFASGVNANFFTHLGAPQDRPHNEIDFEFISNPVEGAALQTNYFVDDTGGHEEFHQVEDADSDFQTYAFDWGPEHLRWYVNGDLIREETGDNLPVPPQKLYLSIWSTGTLVEWMGEFDYPGKPLLMEVDYVAFQPAGSGCDLIESVSCGE